MMAPSVVGGQQKRAPNSCDLCKRMKIRCEKQGDRCSHCVARGIPCNVTPVSRKPRVKKADKFNSIESRIKQMESLLQSSGIVVNSLPSRPEASYSETIEEQTSPPRIDDLSSLVISDAGAQKYIGPSSGFALLSQRGMAWVEEKTGSNRFGRVLHRLRNHAQSCPQFNASQWWPGSNFTRHLLPTRDVAQQLVNHYFNAFNATFPLFDRKTFLTYLDRQYSNDPPTSKAWYGALNIVLSIGCVTATNSMHSDTITDGPCNREGFMELSGRFFQNASSVLTDLLISNNELMAVQTLVGMAFVMQAILNPETSFVLIGAAVRIGHGLGLHRWLDGFGLSQSELEQRRRVFWIIYIVEKSTCIRIGRPSTINDEDIGVPLPPEDLQGEGDKGIDIPSTPGRKFYPFRAACAIALIESKVYSELYSARSWTKSPDERLNRVSRLDQELQEWKDSIPLEIRPEHAIQCEDEHRFATIMLHFVYYNCLTAIHRVSVHHGSWASKDSNAGSYATPPRSPPTSSTSSPLNPRVYASYALCLSAARSTIHMATHFLGFDEDPRNCLIWIAIYFPLSACLTLFAHALQAPLDPRVENDLELMDRSLTSLCRPSNIWPRPAAAIIVDVFGDLTNIAREYVKKARAGNSTAAPICRDLQDGVEAPEMTSFQHPTLVSVQSSGNPPATSTFGSSPGEPASISQPGNLIAEPAAGTPPTEFSSHHPFSFLPFDMADLDPTFMFASDWNQLDFSGVIDHDAEFHAIE